MILDYLRIQAIDQIQSREDRMLAAAVFYAESGFYVIPIRPNEKSAPPKRDGLTYEHASNNPDTVAKWYSTKYKGWNIGICCGSADGIFVLDVDESNGKKGLETLAEMVRDHGELLTAVQVTPSGGKHYVFQWFDNGRSSTEKIAKGIDTRGGDGTNKSHIVAWPSTINGKPYQWEVAGQIMPAPDWLEDLMGTPWDSGQGQGTGRGNENVDDEHMETQFSRRQIWNMLACINLDELTYEEWLQIGQAIHSQHPDEKGLELWDVWSSKGKRYEAGECAKRWGGFKSYGPIRVGTLIHYAKAGGYAPKPNVTNMEFNADESAYDKLIAEMNKEWGLVVVGGKIRVVGKSINSDPEQDLQLMGVEDFKLLTMADKIHVQTPQGPKAVPKSIIWLGDESRKEYRGGIHFKPDEDTEYLSPSGLVYNIWRGWKMEPKKGDWTLLKEHILNIICSGNEFHYEWILDWMADLYQDPANPKGCALVLHGVEGCGKGTLMDAIGKTMGRHYKHLTQEEHLTGRFNGHLQDALLVFADEVTYGGSRKTAGNLKAMVTEPKLMVERKGIDAYSFKNCARIGIASNEDWFIPAGPNSRRWFVLEVAPDMAQNEQYFDAIRKEMNNGGLEAMMYDMLERKITNNLRTAPVTAGLITQRERFVESRTDTLKGWLYDVIESGSMEIVCYKSDSIETSAWPELVSKEEIYAAYKKWAVDNGGTGGLITKPRFYGELVDYGFVEVRPSSPEVIQRAGGARKRMYEVPKLDSLTALYTKITGTKL